MWNINDFCTNGYAIYHQHKIMKTKSVSKIAEIMGFFFKAETVVQRLLKEIQAVIQTVIVIPTTLSDYFGTASKPPRMK